MIRARALGLKGLGVKGLHGLGGSSPFGDLRVSEN